MKTCAPPYSLASGDRDGLAESRQNRRMTDTGAADGADTKRLVVIRHAKTESHASTDHARTLVDRGKRDSRNLGRWMASAELHPDLLMVSSAARARQTADLVVEELGGEPSVLISDELYGAGPFEVIELCGQVEPEVECLAVVGHNPTMEALAALLLVDDDQISHFPTAAVAVIDLPGPWDALEEQSGTLAHLHTPHDD
jgi:phosphohistidine phosphatase